jgi:predicted amino acid racemase
MEDKKRAWLYCRVANPGGVINALEFQERQLQEYCAKNNIDIIGVTKYQGSGLQISDALRNTVLPKAE